MCALTKRIEMLPVSERISSKIMSALKLQEVQIKIAGAIDNRMTFHRNDKGIVHTTSYKQIDFIRENISQENKYRFLETNPEIQRDEVIAEHVNSTKPTVLISPSLS
jgi:ATP-dependent DNA helicase DinG